MRRGGPAPGGILGEHTCRGEEQTEGLAERLAALLSPGDWILLEGRLGAGKTAFVRGLARGLGIDPRRVHSPTFTLVSEYPGPVPLAHVDLYRIQAAVELEELGLDELRERKVIVAVEWGERLPPGAAPAGAWQVTIRPVSPEERLVAVGRKGVAGP